MDHRLEQRLRAKTGLLPLEWFETARGGFAGETKEDFVDVITAAHVVADEAKLGLHRWVDAGRRAGLSWSELGVTLGITKQAAQQRFGSSADAPAAVEDSEIEVRLGATAFNEMGILEAQGRKGRELVGIGALRLHFRQTPHAWEHRRLVGLANTQIARSATEGWSHVASWFPFHYFKRRIP